MIRIKHLAILSGLLMASLTASAIALDSSSPSAGNAPSGNAKLDGVWLAESADMNQLSKLNPVWNAKLTIKGGTFTISDIKYSSSGVKGHLTFDPTDPRAIDLHIDPFEKSGIIYPKCIWPGIYETES